MILTNCAACAAPLAHDAPRCVRCLTRYCNAICKATAHWRGHEQICEEIHRNGAAETYHADKKYKEAVAVAVAKCADDTKGQTCYICLEAVHARTGEGLVRMCACRGASGFAHVACLAEQAKILFSEAEENNLSIKVKRERWERWGVCGLCEQRHHGVVACALGWACWKTYLGRPEADLIRQMAMNRLGNGLHGAGHNEEALSVVEAELSMLRRVGAPAGAILSTLNNLAITYQMLGRFEEALRIRRDVYSGRLNLNGDEHYETLGAAINYAGSLNRLRRFEEAKAVIRKTIPVAQRVLGERNDLTLRMKTLYAQALYKDAGATGDDLREAVETLEDTERIARRVMGGSHPLTTATQIDLRNARAALRARETPSPG